MARLKLTLAYEGTRYAGWQMQVRKDRDDLKTVQGELERAVTRILGQRFPVFGVSRTDAGVHAEGQVCHVDVPDAMTHVDWKKALNVLLPLDIRVLSASWPDKGFHARRSARAKRYAYSLWMHEDRATPRIQAFAWSVPPLEPERMFPAFSALCGRHNFASFQNSGTSIRTTTRTLSDIRWQPGVCGLLACPEGWPVGTLFFEGDGFLKQMVRNLTGLLVWIGLGKLSPEDVPPILAACDRRALPSPSAPAQGLTLLEVLY